MLLEVLKSETRSSCRVDLYGAGEPKASGLPGQETSCGAGGVVVAGTDAAVAGWGDSGAAVGAAVPAATVPADCTAGVLSGIVGTDVTEVVSVETGAT